MLSAEKIYEYIRVQNLPYWKLSYESGGYNNFEPVGHYNCDNLGNAASDDEKVEASIKALISTLDLYKEVPGATFIIKCRESKGTNNSAERNPGMFTLDGSNPRIKNQQQPDLQGIPGQPYQDPSQFGYVPQAQLSAQLEIAREQAKNDFERILLEKDKQAFREEVREMRSEQDNHAKKLLRAGELFWEKYLADDETDGNGMAGKESSESEPGSKEAKVEDLAAFIFKNVPDDLLDGFSGTVKRMIDKRNSQADEVSKTED